MPALTSPTTRSHQGALVHKTTVFSDFEAKAGSGGRVRRFIITSDAMDRDYEVLVPSGLMVDEYLKNPQFLWAHKYDQLPIGACTRLELVQGGRAVAGEFEFAKHKFADEVYGLYRDGFLRAVSIGFRALAQGRPDYGMLAQRPELKDCVRLITRARLFEVSGVAIPSNPEALEEAIRKGLLQIETQSLSSQLLEAIQPAGLAAARARLGKTLELSAPTLARLSPDEVARLERLADRLATTGTLTSKLTPASAPTVANVVIRTDDDIAKGIIAELEAQGFTDMVSKTISEVFTRNIARP